MNKKLFSIIALAVILCFVSFMLVACDETVKDSGGAIIIDGTNTDPSTPPDKLAAKVVLTVNNGNGVATYSYEKNQSVTVVADTAKSGKVFVHWQYEGEIVTENNQYTFDIKNDATLTAVYVDSFVITLNAKGGEVDSSKVTVLDGYLFSLPVPNKINYYFLGYFYGATAYTDAQGKSLKEFSNKVNLTLEAVYQEKPTFSVSVQNGEKDSEIFSYHLDEQKFFDAEPVEGKKFIGWFDQHDNLVESSDTFSFTVTQDLTIVAKYALAYNVTVSYGTGEDVYIEGDEAEVRLIEQTGKRFLYWIITGQQQIFTTDTVFFHTVTADISFEAVFEDILYSVTYYVDKVLYHVDYRKYNENIIPLTPPTKEHHIFSGWSRIPTQMGVNDIEITGSFVLEKFNLTVINGDGGGIYSWGKPVTAIATIPTGKEFLHWVRSGAGGEVVSTDSSYSFVLEQNISITAIFVDKIYYLTYNILLEGEDLANLPVYGDPTQTKQVGGVYAVFELTYGQKTIELSNISCEHYTFGGWGHVPTNMPPNDHSVVGRFTINTYEITIEGGTITVVGGNLSEQGIIAPDRKSGVFDYNSQLKIEATVDIGYEFLKWRIGTTEIMDNPYIFNVTQNSKYIADTQKSVYLMRFWTKAVYENEYTLVHTRPYGYGDIVATYALESRANHYGRWETEIPTIMPNDNVDVYGQYYWNTHTVGITSGTITKVNGELLTQPVSSGTFDYSSVITIKYNNIVGKAFTEWTGHAVSYEDGEYQFVLTKNTNIIANYRDISYTITYMVEQTEHAVIGYNFNEVIDPSRVVNPTKANYHFIDWDVDGAKLPERMPAHDIVCVAVFEIDVHEITLNFGTIIAVDGINLEEAITQGNFDYGTEITVLANTTVGKWFKKWAVANSLEEYGEIEHPSAIYNGEIVITVTKDMELIAIFETAKHTVTVNEHGRIFGSEQLSIVVDYGVQITITNVGGLPGQRFVDIVVNNEQATTTSSYSFEVLQDTNVVVNYEYIEYTVTYILNGAIYDNDIYYSEVYIYTDTHTTLSNPDFIEHYSFGGWVLDGYYPFPSKITKITNNIEIRGTYIIDTHDIVVTSGQITAVNGEKLQEPLYYGNFDYGTQLTITAIFEVGEYFVEWTNNSQVVSSDNPYTFMLDGDADFEASIAKYVYKVQYFITDGENDVPYLDHVDYEYLYNQEIEYLATPTAIENSVFVGWYLYDGLDIPTHMIDAENKILKVYGFFQHIFSYELTTDGQNYIVSRNLSVPAANYPADIIIPTTYDGKAVVEIAENAFSYLLLNSVIINSNILVIGSNAFSNCDLLTSIVLPFVGQSKDSTNNKLSYIFGTVPVSLQVVEITHATTIAAYAFSNLSDIIQIVLPDTLLSIGAYAFSGCSGLSAISLPINLVEIGDNAFANCSGLAEIVFNAQNLNNLSQDNNVFGIGALELSIVIGSDVTSIPDYLFYPSMQNPLASAVSISFEANSSVASIGKFSFAYANITSIVLPSTLTTIGESAFYSSALVAINLHSNITNIGASAFAQIQSQDISFGANLVGVGSSSKIFEGTTGNVVVANNVLSIPSYLFIDASIGSISFAENSVCISIGSFAFAQNDELQSIEIPQSVTTVGELAFAYCITINQIFYNAINITNIDINTNLFLGSGADIVLYIGSEVTNIPSYLCYVNQGFVDIVSIVVASNNNCQYIGEYAFYNLSNLTTIGEFLYAHTIGAYAFSNCDNLTQFYISAVTKVIGQSAFDGCNNIKFYCELARPLLNWSENWNNGKAVHYAINNIYNADFRYVVHKQQVYITNYIGTKSQVIVPEYIDSYKVVCIANAFYKNQIVEYIELPQFVTVIVDYAFSGCSNLLEVVYSGEITYLGAYAFADCVSLLAFVLPQNITVVEQGTFKNCIALDSINLENITIIAKEAFYNCASIEQITLSNVLTTIEELAFADCTSLLGVEIPQSVTYIAHNAFIRCGSMQYYNVHAQSEHYTSVSGVLFDKNMTTLISYPPQKADDNYQIPMSVLAISQFAFYNAINLESITITDNVEYIGQSAFDLCVNLVAVYYNAEDARIENDSIIFSKAGSEGSGMTVEIGDQVVAIPQNLFSGEDIFMVSLTIGQNVVSIGKNAFINAHMLTIINYNANNLSNFDSQNKIFVGAGITSGVTVNIGGGVVSIPDYLFYSTIDNEINITAINFVNSNLTYIGKYSFYGANIDTITILSSVTTIGEQAFGKNTLASVINFNATNLSNNLQTDKIFDGVGTSLVDGVVVNIGSGVLNIPDYFNYNLAKVATINIDSTVLLRVGKYAFMGTAITQIDLPSTVTEIGEYAFYGLDFDTLLLPSDIQSIGSYAFYGMAQVDSLILPVGLQTIGEHAFDSLAISTITIPVAVTKIGANAFANITDLQTINYNAVEILDEDTSKVFVGSGAEGSPIIVTIGSNVLRIPNYLFADCQFIQTVIFSGNTVCHTISAYAFSMCVGLQDIVDLPQSIATIGEHALEYTAITTLNLSHTLGTLVVGSYAFNGCGQLENITFANDSALEKINDYAFYGCINLLSIDFGTNSKLDYIGSYAFANCIMLDMDLPSTIANTNVDGQILQGIGEYAFYNCQSITKITIPVGVVAIFEYTFASCISIEEVVYHNDILYIGEYAFANCESLENIEISENVTFLGNNAFENCKAVISLCYYPSANVDTVNDSDNATFKNLGINGAGTAITIGKHVKTIPEYLFFGSSDNVSKIVSIEFLTDINGNSAVASIGERAFYYAIYLQQLVLPEGLQTIGKEAFAQSHNLQSLTIPSSVVDIAYRAFAYSYQMIEVYFNSSVCADFVNSELSTNNSEVFVGAGTYSSEEVTLDGITLFVGSSVTRLPENMFYTTDDNSKVKLIVMQHDAVLETIAPKAFRDQNVLTDIENIPQTIKYVGAEAFANCYDFVCDSVMEYALTLGSKAFYNCFSLPAIHLSEDLYYLTDDSIFMNCSAVQTVNVYSKQLPYGDAGFISYNTIFKGVGLTILEDYGNGNYEYDYDNSDGFVLNIYQTVEYIPNYFMHNEEGFIEGPQINNWTLNIQEINIYNPDLVIGDFAFAGIGKLQTLTLGELHMGVGIDKNTLQLGNYAFYGCKDLQTLILNNVSMGYLNENGAIIESTHIFAYSSQLHTLEVTNHATVEIISKYAFYMCESLQVINPNRDVEYIPQGETGLWRHVEANIGTVGDYAFAHTALVEVYLSSIVSGIGSYAFYSCQSLTTFRWPERVISVGEYAFADCINLQYTSYLDSTMQDYGTDITNYATLFADGAITTIAGEIVDTLYIGDRSEGRFVLLTVIGAYAFENTLLNIKIEEVNNLVEGVQLSEYAFSGMNGTLEGIDNINSGEGT